MRFTGSFFTLILEQMSDFHFVTNTITRATRRTGPDGREYLVAPGVALVAGVVGNEYVPASEIAKAAFGFNGRPLPLSHPMLGDEYISANSPEQHHAASIGQFWNATFDGTKLKGEYWIDVAKAQAMGGDALALLQRLEANQQVETSTAYGRDFDATPGNFNGKSYTGIARNLVPDHVAVLISEQGKCSISDGCGLLANACTCSGQTLPSETIINSNLEVVQMSKDTEVKTAAEPVVEPVAKAEAPVVEKVEKAEAKQPVVNAVAANSEQFVAVNAELAATKAALTTITNMISDLGGVDKVRETLQLAGANAQAMAANAKREKEILVSALISNARCAFSRDDLGKFDIDALGKFAQSLQPVDYSGRSFAANNAITADELVDLEELDKEAK